MKKILILITCFAMVFTSCEDELENKFGNPDKQTSPDIPLFFTGALQQGHLFRADYGSYYHQMRQLSKVTGLGIYPFLWSSSQEWIVLNDWSGPSFYYDVYNKSSVPWVKNINAMQLQFNGLPEEEKKDFEVYFHLADIVKGFVYQRATDLYDDIPYSEASGAYREIFYPKFDTQEFIYKDVIEKLGTATEALKNIQLTDFQKNQLATYDILNFGDIDLWVKFGNSLRLRMAMRLSVVDPDYSKSVIEEMTASNAEYVSENSEVIGIEELNKVTLTAGGAGTFFPRGFQERGWDLWAPRFIMEDIFNYTPNTPINAVDDTVDPRTFVIFQPNTEGKYIPLPEYERIQAKAYLEQYLPVADANDIIEGNHQPSNASWDVDDQLASKYNRVTFLNSSAKFPTFVPAETYLLLAEAAIRFPGSVSITAEDAYEKSVALSIDYFYTLNETNLGSASTLPPLVEVDDDYYVKRNATYINNFVAQRKTMFSGLADDKKIEEIFYQKVANFSVFNQFEVFSEARRLMKDHGLLLKPVIGKVEWLERLYYPPSEERDNPDNFATVAGQNNVTTPVWWTGRK